MNTSTIVSLQNASVFQKETKVLSDVTFDVSSNEFIYVIGKTGSGKSSLLKTMYADLWLSSGKGWVAGIPLHEIKRKEIPFLRRKIGIVFQDFQLLSDRSIERNLHFFMEAMGWSDQNAMKKRIEEVLSQVGLSHVLPKLPHQLSGGEQQRVSIARALLNKPLLLLADEPTGNLDPEMSQEILQLFFQINKEIGTAVLMATHDFSLIEKYPSRTLYCKDGKVQDLTRNSTETE